MALALRAPGVGCQASARPEYPRRATSPHHARTFAEAAELVFTSPLPEGKVVRFSKELAYYGAHSTLPHMPPTLLLTTCIHLPCNMQPFRTRWTLCSKLATPTFNTRSLFATQPTLYGQSIARTESLASRLMRQRLVSQPCTRCCSGSRSYLLPGRQSYSTQMSLSPTLRRCEPWR